MRVAKGERLGPFAHRLGPFARAGTMLAAGATAAFAFSGSDIVTKFNSWKREHEKVHHAFAPSLAPASVR